MRWLKNLMMIFVKPTVPQTAESFGVDKSKPICYVLRTNSLSDRLVLDHCTQQMGLPRPIARISNIFNSGHASVISLLKISWFRTSRKGSRIPPPQLKFMLEMLNSNLDKDIQLVPVTVIWGRGPLSEDKSFTRAFFSDDVNAGVIQKLFIILYQGRNTVIQFGEPISLRAQLELNSDVEQTSKKLRRVLRVHFHSQRAGLVGPRTVDRQRTYAAILSSKIIKELIQSEAKRTDASIEEMERRVKKTLGEIVADQKYSIIRAAQIILSRFWAKTFRQGIRVHGQEKLFELSKNYEIIYAPCHRSHFDYLMHSYVLHEYGLPSPHIAAGVNLNFWPIGRILRKGGAFFLRRSIKGDRMYAIIFREYLNYLIMRGHSITFYIEGGRSRTGRLLAPKTGMLSMIVQSFLRGTDRPVAIVPCYIGYDKVIEIRSYMKELSGKKKTKESIFQLIKIWRYLGVDYGQGFVSFGEPIYMEKFLDQSKLPWREATDGQKPDWLSPAVDDLARVIMENITRSTFVNPVGLVAVALLSSPQKSMGEIELVQCVDFLRSLVSESKYSNQIHVTEMKGQAIVKYVETLGQIRRFEHEGNDVIYVHDIEAFLLGYYRNNILHLFAMPSLISSFFQHNDSMSVTQLRESCSLLYPFLKVELFLPWEVGEFKQYMERLIDDFVRLQLLTKSGDQLTRANVNTPQFSHLMLLGRTLGQTFDRFAVVAALLGKHNQSEELDREEIEQKSQLMAQRISLLAGKSAPEFADKQLFSNYFEILKKHGYLQPGSPGKVKVDNKIIHLYDCSIHLLGADMRNAIQRM